MTYILPKIVPYCNIYFFSSSYVREEKSIAAGKKSQKAEAFRIGGKALRAAVMGLLAELIRNIIGKLITWLKSKEKSLKTFLGQVKEAISAFLKNIKIRKSIS